MAKKYFRKKDPNCRLEDIEWIEMIGREYYRFVNDPANQERHFIDMGDAVLETTEADARGFKAEQNHSYYIQAQEDGWSTLSIYAIGNDSGCNGEEVVADPTQDVEKEVIMRMDHKALRAALTRLDTESRRLIHALYFSDDRKSERELAKEFGVSQNAINKRKQKILQRLKFLVVKVQKNQQ